VFDKRARWVIQRRWEMVGHDPQQRRRRAGEVYV
jgi:hypothetical protein